MRGGHRLERHIEDAVVRWCREEDILNRKMNGLGFKSWPDRGFFLKGGKPFLIEFKKPGEELSPLQADTIKRLRELGYEVEVHTFAEEAKAAIRRRLEAKRVPKKMRKVPVGTKRSGVATRAGNAKDKHNPRRSKGSSK